jgi:CHAT domain-containing protein
MEVFYKNLLSGMNKGEALRKAKISLMKGTEMMEGKKVSYSHPFFWAPFILVGKSNQ